MTTITEEIPILAEKPEKSQLAGFNVLLMGPAGTGKTHSIGTLVETELEVFYLGLESGLESLVGYFTDRGKPIPDNLHWHVLEAPTASFTELLTNAKNINTLSLETLAKLHDPNRNKHNQFIKLLEALNNFPDDRNGKLYGPINEWTPKQVLIIDGLTGLGQAAMSLVVGGKAVKNMSDWGIAQSQVENLTRMLCDSCKCHFVLLAHVERETDQILGGVKLMISTLGRALSPKLPAMFSDVILTVRQADKWTWDTASAIADVKTRNLPISASNAADFKTILNKWKSRGGLAV